MTVEKNKPLSHSKIGWNNFTDEVIKKINIYRENIVFILWGSHAHSKASLIDSDKHLILKSAHPSPLSAYRGFFGSKPFSQTNKYLIKELLFSLEESDSSTNHDVAPIEILPTNSERDSGSILFNAKANTANI